MEYASAAAQSGAIEIDRYLNASKQLPEDTRFPLCKDGKPPLALHPPHDGTNRAMRRVKSFLRKSV